MAVVVAVVAVSGWGGGGRDSGGCVVGGSGIGSRTGSSVVCGGSWLTNCYNRHLLNYSKQLLLLQ